MNLPAYTTKRLGQLLTAVVFGSLFCAGMAAFDCSSDLTRRQLSLRMNRAESGEPQSEATVQDSDSNEQDNAGIPIFTCLPSETRIQIRRCSESQTQVVASVFATNPDHLIVLPGTPPPFVA
ncbi:MAG: hypothetical protein AB7G28_17635 [Pirellulales bacterium]